MISLDPGRDKTFWTAVTSRRAKLRQKPEFAKIPWDLSRTVKDLTAGSGLHFDDRGEFELKGVPERWQLYAVTA